mgnify:CR=1 FL=1
MRESFEYEGTTTGEYRCGLYATYAGKDYEAVYLGYGRFILYSKLRMRTLLFRLMMADICYRQICAIHC